VREPATRAAARLRMRMVFMIVLPHLFMPQNLGSWGLVIQTGEVSFKHIGNAMSEIYTSISKY
jgi:hypothetical protein